MMLILCKFVYPFYFLIGSINAYCFIDKIYQVSGFVFVGNIIFILVILGDSCFIRSRIGEQKRTVAAFGYRKGFFTNGMVFYDEKIAELPAFTKRAIGKFFIHFIFPGKLLELKDPRE